MFVCVAWLFGGAMAAAGIETGGTSVRPMFQISDFLLSKCAAREMVRIIQ
jgi:hypothetical protein